MVISWIHNLSVSDLGSYFSAVTLSQFANSLIHFINHLSSILKQIYEDIYKTVKQPNCKSGKFLWALDTDSDVTPPYFNKYHKVLRSPGNSVILHSNSTYSIEEEDC